MPPTHFPTFALIWSCIRSIWPRFWSFLLRFRLALLTILIFTIWQITWFPWAAYGREILVTINIALGLLVLFRAIRWPGFLSLVAFVWILANIDSPRERHPAPQLVN